MTGEITLRGLVLPIGGLKEKTLAAKRAGITDVIIPKRNEKDLVEIPDEVRKALTFHPVENVDEVLKPSPSNAPPPRRDGKPAGNKPAEEEGFASEKGQARPRRARERRPDLGERFGRRSP